MELFFAADENNDGVITISEFKSGFGVASDELSDSTSSPSKLSGIRKSMRKGRLMTNGPEFGTPKSVESAHSPHMLTSRSAPALPDVHSKPGTGRFYEEELTCFRKLALPSSLFDQKEELFWKSTGALRRAFSESGLHIMPATKGNFWDAGKAELVPTDIGEKPETVPTPFYLPGEEQTGKILDDIFPRSPASSSQASPGTSKKDNRSAAHSPPRKAVQPLPQIHHAEFARGAIRNRARLMAFRQKLMDKFCTTKNAFDSFCSDLNGGMDRELRKKEFINFLNKHFGAAGKEEQERIFDFLDMDKNGCVSMMEFHTAIEAAQPLRTMEDLRRRLIALGTTSMRNAISQMFPDADVGTSDRSRGRADSQYPAKRMTLIDFTTALTRVGVRDEEEVATLFASICPEYCDTITVEELTSSMAAVSPALLLEDVRDKLLKKHSTLSKAYEHIDKDRNNGINIWEFRMLGEHLKMSPRDVDKLFRLIDVDCNQTISRSEFVSALQLSEPTLFLEEVRRKVRQRFRSILGALHLAKERSSKGDDGFSGDEDGSPRGRNEAMASAMLKTEDQAHGKTSGDFLQVLSTVQLTESDTQVLFQLIDANKDGQLTTQEFLRGIRIFAPSCMLEDLRLECLRLHGTVGRAFDSLGPERRDVVLDARSLEEVFAEIGLSACVEIRAIFDILESRRDGGVTCGEVACALAGAAPGNREPLSAEARTTRARVQIRNQMAPFRRIADELRSSVRQKAPKRYYEEPAPLSPSSVDEDSHLPMRRPPNRMMTRKMTRSRSQPASPVAPAPDVPSPPASRSGVPPPGSADSAGSAQRTALVVHPQTGQSYRKVSKLVGKLPEKEKRTLERNLHSYYKDAGGTIDRDVRLLSGKQSRYDHFRDNCAHKRVLAKPLW